MEPRRACRLKPSSAVWVILLIMSLHALAMPSIAEAVQNPVTNSMAVSSSSTPGNATGQLTIDKSVFENSVPSSAIVGENYTLRVQIQSTVNMTVPIIVRVITPVGAIFVHPQILRTDIPAMGSLTANFTIVPFVIWHQGPMNVTASVSVWFIDRMSTPQLVDQATAQVFNISPSGFPYLPVLLLSAAAVVIVLVVVFKSEIFRREGEDTMSSEA